MFYAITDSWTHKKVEASVFSVETHLSVSLPASINAE